MGVGFCMYTITRDDTANLNGLEIGVVMGVVNGYIFVCEII